MADYYQIFAKTVQDFPEKAANDLNALISFADTREFPEPEEPLGGLPEWYAKKHNLTDDQTTLDTQLAQQVLDAQDIYSCGTDVIIESSKDGKCDLYLKAELNGDPHAVMSLMSEVMQEHKIDEPIILEAAVTCSRMRSGAFGGMVTVAGPGVVMHENTWSLGTTLKDMIARNEDEGELRPFTTRTNNE
jgi:hypothetical protein